ncbi:hypothetical protein AZE42_05895 [Rhizopogon vesiculosus]|uniref:Uncharacterized protein n=1 Tax=Rhizopogon vesiculosus TaxID=180088 RepID=A0A1J8QAW9_9AGAM|nr:hypothetical protein AZE42_05895 [Rhizopogon vesiculosus]
MAMDIANGEPSIMEWDEDQVHRWLSSIGFAQYEAQIKEHNISGDALCLLDAEGLKGIGISTVGQRLAILKAVYQAKLAHNVPVEADHYIPPSEVQERSVTVEKLHDLVKEQAQKVHSLEEDNKRLSDTVQQLLQEFNHARGSRGTDDTPTLKRQPSFKWAQYVNPTKSPTKPDVESPQPSPQQTEPDIPHSRGIQHSQPQPHRQTSAPIESPIQPSPSTSTSSRPSRQDSTDNLKTFKVSLDDPTWKVLPAALKKYKINNDNWQNYAMFICYGSAGNRIERCLSYDEKPLLLFQKLKDAKKNPVFMLKHIKDIRSPIAVAQQKHALRKASVATESSSSQSNRTSTTGQGKTGSRPPKLEVHDFSAPPLTGTTPHAGWPEVISPIVEKQEQEVLNNRDTCSSTSTTLVGHTSTAEGSKSRTTGTADADTSKREMPPPMSGVSYAVAIYPYMAEQDDEFDVIVGDTFVILSRARGWWVVQRDPTGSGVVDTDTSKQGWVPAGCLLETNVPVASAIAEATAAKTSCSSELPSVADSKTPILPLSIISTSFPGIALMDYKKKGEEELDLVKDDALRVFKKYNHWSYAVKEDGGDRGWVPSWFIGKVPTPGGVPPTPSTSSAPALSSGPSVSLDPEISNQNQVSPMSSAFPPPNRSGVI